MRGGEHERVASREPEAAQASETESSSVKRHPLPTTTRRGEGESLSFLSK